MQAAIRLGDPISCGDTMGAGSGNVFVNGIPMTRALVDKTVGHCFEPVPVISGSGTVFVNNLPAARMGDPIAVHCCPPPNCHSGVCANGSTNVFVG